MNERNGARDRGEEQVGLGRCSGGCGGVYVWRHFLAAFRVMASLGLSDLPHVLAMLNGASLVLMTAGYINIRQGRKGAHRGFMAGALGVSVAFMVVYLTYHFSGGVARFGGEGAVRIVYFGILISHIVLAAVIAVLVPVTAVLAFRHAEAG